ncbi:MAG: hypothetical protein WB441_15675 [Nocardioidaceae bacterium]
MPVEPLPSGAPGGTADQSTGSAGALVVLVVAPAPTTRPAT